MERPQQIAAQLNPIPVACKKLGGISRRTFYNLIESGELRSVKVGARRMVSDAAIAEFIDRLSGSDAA